MAGLQTDRYPTAKHEDWKYTALAPWFDASNKYGEPSDIAIEPFSSEENAVYIDVVNGILTLPETPKGVTFKQVTQAEIAELADFQTDIKERVMAQDCVDADDAWLLVEVADRALVESPIVIRSTNSANTQAFARMAIRIGEAAQARVIEEVACADQATSNQMTLVSLAKNAILKHAKFEQIANTAFHFAHYFVNQVETSHYNSTTLLLGGRIARQETIVNFNGSDAECDVNSLYLGNDEQVLDTRSLIRHNAPNCFSRQLHKGVLAGNAGGVFNGRIFVDPVALKTDGLMDNNVLLLSPTAQNNSKPQLEIYADDVKCSHGFTCGQLDQRQLFYMQARGIPEKQAKALMIYAFAADVVEHISSASLRRLVEPMIKTRLEKWI